MRRSLRRRRQEAKTDYATRLSLLSSGKPRLVIRKTNKIIIAQLVKSEVAQDSLIAQATSKDLLNHGWPKEKAGSLKNRAAAYLTGYLLSSNAKGKARECILDLGMHRNIHKSRLYAALKGAIDGGLIVPHSAEVLPPIEQINTKEFAQLIEKIKKTLHHG